MTNLSASRARVAPQIKMKVGKIYNISVQHQLNEDELQIRKTKQEITSEKINNWNKVKFHATQLTLATLQYLLYSCSIDVIAPSCLVSAASKKIMLRLRTYIHCRLCLRMHCLHSTILYYLCLWYTIFVIHMKRTQDCVIM